MADARTADSNIGLARAYAPLPLGYAVTKWWQDLSRNLFDAYRPERHYMRGPGPKWHAKHNRPITVVLQEPIYNEDCDSTRGF